MWRHCRHVGGQKQYIFSALGNKIYFHVKLFHWFSPSTWPPWKPSIHGICLWNLLNRVVQGICRQGKNTHLGLLLSLSVCGDKIVHTRYLTAHQQKAFQMMPSMPSGKYHFRCQTGLNFSPRREALRAPVSRERERERDGLFRSFSAIKLVEGINKVIEICSLSIDDRSTIELRTL